MSSEERWSFIGTVVLIAFYFATLTTIMAFGQSPIALTIFTYLVIAFLLFVILLVIAVRIFRLFKSRHG